MALADGKPVIVIYKMEVRPPIARGIGVYLMHLGRSFYPRRLIEDDPSLPFAEEPTICRTTINHAGHGDALLVPIIRPRMLLSQVVSSFEGLPNDEKVNAVSRINIFLDEASNFMRGSRFGPFREEESARLRPYVIRIIQFAARNFIEITWEQ